MKHKKVSIQQTEIEESAYQPPLVIEIKSDGNKLRFDHVFNGMYVYKYTNRFTESGRLSTKFGTFLPLRREDIERLLNPIFQ